MMNKFDVTTVGEVMLRLSTPAGQRLEMANQLDVQPGGAESNVVALLARLGRTTAWLGGLPDNPLGRLAANHLRMAGVNLEGVVWEQDGRMGAYYVEFATPPRPIQVVYDRAGSSAATLQPAQVQWDRLLATRLLHLTGITPALSVSSAAIIHQAVARARAAKTPISFDVNFRSKLWDSSTAAATLRPLITGVDLLFCGQGDAALLFGCSGAPESMIHQLAAQFAPGVVVMSVGDAGALAWDGATLHHAPASTAQVIDRLGAGDALAAGVIHGWLGGDLAAGLAYGVTLAGVALSQHGDMVITTAAELESLVSNSQTRLIR